MDHKLIHRPREAPTKVCTILTDLRAPKSRYSCPYLADLRPTRRIFAIFLSNLADLRTSPAKTLRLGNGHGKVGTKDFFSPKFTGIVTSFSRSQRENRDIPVRDSGF